MNLSGKKINTWYKNFLSDFSFSQEEKKKFPEKNYNTVDTTLEETLYIKEKVIDTEKTLQENRGKNISEHKKFYKEKISKKVQNKEVRVPICKAENFGSNMCIDDKNLGEHGFTIISNLDTGKIACMIETRKSEIINKVLKKHVAKERLESVQVLTKDLAGNYEKVREKSFLFAVGVADKFHVVKLGMQALSDLRVSYRQEELTKERLRREAHKCNEASNRKLALRAGNTYETKKCPPAPRMKNGETVLQLLVLTNKALSQFQNKWGTEMKERVSILFHLFPNLEKMYQLISAFRGIYTVKEFGENILKKAKISLEKWFKSVGASEITELQNFASTVMYHRKNILAYFKTGQTNAYAESLNAKLQRFLRENFGIKNLDFFLWRIKKIFS